MNIENALKHLTNEMKRLVGERLIKKMLEVFENEESARNWFYTHSVSFEEKRPYDYCIEGKIQEIENELEKIQYGVF
jgi:uncharacterized protein (DUF2384 family)